MPKLPFMQVYVAELLSTTTLLTLEQRGGFYTILFAMWQAGGNLPNDPTKLARMCGISLKRWNQISPDFLAFFQVDGDQLTQERLSADYNKGLALTEKKRAAGKLGNLAKSLKSQNTTSADANANEQHSVRNYNHNHTQNYNQKKKEEDESLTALPLDLHVVKAKEGKRPRTSKTKISKEVLETEFQNFMRQYPNPIDEDDARTAYFAARRSGRGTAEEILNGALRYAAEKTGTEPKYIKAPQNWLRAGSWKNPGRAAVMNGTDGREVFGDFLKNGADHHGQ